ncbi:MucR family transcriptional regulator [Methylobacterium radiodurans]|uniref:MucR family transcriptional regulator n=1 Tax=Methylobacterium radiodurans TaxID=2202828 RepID=A0A2U8VWS6_9HYPH|nr:MucR family transcriptional regulator [Methylobacterium radiodurans]AWN38264.1 MucR family transcriptional regulator [Methylobacterium radiodurans]
MAEQATDVRSNLVEEAVDIVSAYVSNNSVPAAELGGLIAGVHAALLRLTLAGASSAPAEEPVEKPSAAQIRKSVTDEGLISFIDGKTYKTLKRHLTTHGLDPRSYRQRYGLPDDYPMVAPAYAAQRSALAKQIGLGRPGAMAERAAPAEKEPPAGGRRRKS